MIENFELELAQKTIEMAREGGAQSVRVTLSKSVSDLFDTLNGEIDKVTHCLDRSLSINLFVDGRYGSFSTNRLEEEDLRAFVATSLSLTRLLAPDPARTLPSPERLCKNAVGGNELELYDDSYTSTDAEMRRRIALEASIFTHENQSGGYKIISEEGQYSDSELDLVTIDSNGLFARQLETAFEYGVEITIEAADGAKYSGYEWEAAPLMKDLDIRECGAKALGKAVAQIGSEGCEGGKYNLVLDNEVAYKFVTPLLNALNGYSLQQGNSFLNDSLGKQVLGEGLTLIDDPHRKGESGSRLFDSEGVATRKAPIIEGGIVKQYFINSYISGKMNIAPTAEDCSRAHLLPWPRTGLDRDAILSLCGRGIYVTGFNGGNCNSATGDFSYGIEGFLFEDGKLGAPVSEMLVTGNFLTLWNNLVAAGDDIRLSASKLIPTLAFKNVDING